MKWAIRGTYIETPTCTMLVYPMWDAKPYHNLLDHPRVHILRRVPQPHFSFDTPAKYTGTPDARPLYVHWDAAFIVVANTPGYAKYVDETQATDAFKKADTTHCKTDFPVTLLTRDQKTAMTDNTHDVMGPSEREYHPDTTDTQPDDYMLDKVELEALRGEYGNTLPMGTAATDDVYTDEGSLKRGDELKAGAGVYFTSSGRVMHVRFTGKRAILRADLIAIVVALAGVA